MSRLRPLLALWLGFLWALLYASFLLDSGIEEGLQGKDLNIQGVVTSLPDHTERRTRFEFLVERMEFGDTGLPSPGRIRLSWYRSAPEIEAGQRWRLVVRLKSPRGFANPGGFDYEGWLFQRGIRASGYVRKSEHNGMIGESGGLVAIQRWRQAIRNRISSMSAEATGAALLNGLVVGDRSGINQDQWRLFARTGTSHLIAISGLHIGIVFGLVFFLMRRVWAISKILPLLIPAPQAAALFGLVAATIYAAMAGFAIPTQRALVMLLVFVAGYLLRRPPRPSQALAMSLLLVVLWDPLAVLTSGFWLSFCAVAVIFFGTAGRVGKIAWLQQWGRVQWMISLGLAPVLLAMGLQISLLAPMINLLAVPLFTLFVVPLCLVTVLMLFVFQPLGAQLLELTNCILMQGLACLDYLGGVPFVVWTSSELPVWVWVSVVVGVVLLLSPRGLPGRWLGLVFLAPIVLVRPVVPEYGSVNFTVLDVGQGLAVVIRTRRHTMLYDLGPRFSDDFDTGSAVVVPYLRSSGIDHVDLLMLSNGDLDHSGGLSGILGQVEISSILSGEPGRLHVTTGRCGAGDSWNWDGVSFKVLHPAKDNPWEGNDSSCVLKIDVAGRSLLIPGDIERDVERRLLYGVGGELESDLVIIPHHGSKSSSTIGFVRATSPRYAIVSAGYRNRYGFPDDGVVGRWRSVGTEVLNTAELGAIELNIAANGTISEPKCYRLQQRRYWQKHLSPRM